ncbi:761_t:CDS:2 [Ambispora leptoticha]|uniref:761_t:CDS:1 n=1 Tax=Ambispora leptoticha TaxID=144679 RepID=A0A9N9A4Q7_9GLOM|nr:761_t:CDS:2 [Ambispora leptoticha]
MNEMEDRVTPELFYQMEIVISMSSSKSNSRGRNSPLYTYAALAVAAAGIVYYVYQRSQFRERRDNRTGGEEGTGSELERNEAARRNPNTTQTRLRRRVTDLSTRGRSVQARQSVRLKRKAMSISLKDTLVWNPSNDPDSPNYAFVENILPLLQVLTKSYDIHLVAPVKNEPEKEQILSLFRNADLFSPIGIDERKVLFCETEEGKIHIVRHLESSVHIEGGSAETVDLVRGFVERIVWINSRSNNTIGITSNGFTISSSNSASSSSGSSVDTSQWINVEICKSLLLSSLNHDRQTIKRKK